MDKKEEDEGTKAVCEVIEAIANSIEKEKNRFIGLMVDAMEVEAKIIRDARAKGIEFEKIMPEVKAEYFKRVNEAKQKAEQKIK